LIRQIVHSVSLEQYCCLWTINYFLDGTRILVRRDSGFQDYQDLNRQTISVLAGTTTEVIFFDWFNALGIDYEILAYSESSDLYDSFFSGRADAVTSGWLALLNKTQGDSTYRVIGEIMHVDFHGREIGREPYAIGVPSTDPEFRDIIDETLFMIITDGTWQKFYDHYFPDPPPWTLEKMIAEPPANR
jgi:ABC-type amino acid transport substrate-binding protein